MAPVPEQMITKSIATLGLLDRLPFAYSSFVVQGLLYRFRLFCALI